MRRRSGRSCAGRWRMSGEGMVFLVSGTVFCGVCVSFRDAEEAEIDHVERGE